MPVLPRIDGKTRHYPYTPAGKKQYEKDKQDMGDTAERKRQSGMVMNADLNDQSKGAKAYIQKKYGKGEGWYPTDFSSIEDFKSAAMDVISESEVSSKFPKDVWERGADSYLTEVWTRYPSKFKTMPKRNTPIRKK